MQILCLSEHFFFCSVDDGGDFVGYLLGGELDVVPEGLLRLVATDEHHLNDGEFV